MLVGRRVVKFLYKYFVIIKGWVVLFVKFLLLDVFIWNGVFMNDWCEICEF